MVQLRVQRPRYEDLLNRQSLLWQIHQVDGQLLTAEQDHILEAQLRTQRELSDSLLQGGDTLLLELARLKVSNGQLEDAPKEVSETTHRYLPWISNMYPMIIAWPLEIVQDLRRFTSLDTSSQLGRASVMMLTSKETVLSLFGVLILIGYSAYSYYYLTHSPERSVAKVGKVTQGHFWLTLRALSWSILVASSLLVLWITLGHGLREAWLYPPTVVIGGGIATTVSLLWVVMICATFVCPSGLFIAHLGWPCEQVSCGARCYLTSTGFIVPLTMALMMFDNLDDREFSSSLGWLCFIPTCGALTVVTLSLEKTGTPLHLSKEGSGDNATNHMLRNMTTGAPSVAILVSVAGYLATTQALLARLETLVVIWLLLLVVYYVTHRWVLIQRCRLVFNRAKRRRIKMLAQYARGEEEVHHHSSPEGAVEVGESEVDLGAISAQSSQLVCLTLMLTALPPVTVLWLEIHPTLGFFENISLWDTTFAAQGAESLELIILDVVLTAILVFIITAQLARNLPTLLELAILQHLDLTPGMGYAITTITKHLLMLIDGLIGSSMIGIEWPKSQWLVIALGVGLDLDLQEISANFISDSIILFKRPIRVGDTVTTHDLISSVTKINIHAIAISGWDRKEMIVPNRVFITEQFTNWSLSDSITYVVLMIPASVDTNSEEVTEILLTTACRCSLVTDDPVPEASLVNL